MQNAGKETRLSSVATAMLLLKCFTDEHHELGIGKLAARLGLAKSTVHRLAVTLVQAGMLEQNKENGRYRLGLTVFELGSLVRRRMDIYTEGKTLLRDLRGKTGESVNLAILRGDNVMYLNSLESQSAIKVAAAPGMRLPAHCAAEGKVLLAFSTAEDQARIIGQGLASKTPQTITDLDVLRAELSLIKGRRYAIDNEETEIGVRSIAAPVFGSDNEVVAAVGIAGPVQRLNKRMMMSFLPALSGTVEAISYRLGATRPAGAGVLQVVKS